MRLAILTGLTAFLAASGIAAPMTAHQREEAIWQDIKDKHFDVFAATLEPKFVSVYGDGVNDKSGELGGVRGIDLQSFTISDFRTHLIDAQDELVTYLLDMRATAGKADISGRFWTTSLWHRQNGVWMVVYHSEVSAH